jgi:prophage regulatory protein
MQDPTPSITPAPRRIIRLRAVRECTALGRSTIYTLESAGLFPRRLHLGPRAVGWYEHEVAAWVDSRRRAEAST